MRGTIGRFTRWGLTHGPVWGTLAAILGGVPLAIMLDAGIGPVQLVLLGAFGGLVAGPVLGGVVGTVCVLTDRVPKWILDAPDYMAVLTVVGSIGAVTWPVLRDAGAGAGIAALGVVLIAGAPAIDAARSASLLLYPAEPATDAGRMAVAPRGQAS